MSITSKPVTAKLKYHPEAYRFVDNALRYAQKQLGRAQQEESDTDSDAHITGQELLEGIRTLALKQFGLLTQTVFHYWGIHSTDDFGRIVFDFIERGAMRKTDRDQLHDFFDVYDFNEVFDRDYQIDTSPAFR